jgi:glutamate formiminotransferase/formiminotetrahydrofolate cyclodeaminase
MGAADVVPFIPLDGATMDDCIAAARALGERVGRELEIPVYLYERAATCPERRNLADVRRGGFEAIRTEIAAGETSARIPDFGPRCVHPTAGAVAIGARPFLVAFNVYLGDASRLAIAKAVAKAVRESSGGLPAVKALGLEVDGQAQVSMNLVDLERTSLAAAYDAVVQEAAARGVSVTWSEIIGLVPDDALLGAAAAYLRLRDSASDHLLERRLLEVRGQEQTTRGFLHAVGSSAATPGGGSVAAYAGALGAALVQMVAGMSKNDALHTTRDDAERLATQLMELVARDAAAYDAVVHAYRLPQQDATQVSARADAIHAALLGAARVPLQTARLSARAAELAVAVATHGSKRTITDAGVAALMADAACRSAAYNVRVNVRALANDEAVAADLAVAAEQAVAAASRDAATVAQLVETALR